MIHNLICIKFKFMDIRLILSIYFVVYLFIDIIVLSHLHRVLLETLVSLEHLVLTAKLEREVFKAHLAQLVPLVWLVYQDSKDDKGPLEQRAQREMVDLLENEGLMEKTESRDKMECQDLQDLRAHQEKRVRMV